MEILCQNLPFNTQLVGSFFGSTLADDLIDSSRKWIIEGSKTNIIFRYQFDFRVLFFNINSSTFHKFFFTWIFFTCLGKLIWIRCWNYLKVNLCYDISLSMSESFSLSTNMHLSCDVYMYLYFIYASGSVAESYYYN